MRLSRSGQAIVEFAFVAPLFFVLVLGGSEIGWLMFQKRILDYAARQGARAAAMDTSASKLVASVSTGIPASARQVIKDTVRMYGGPVIPDAQITLAPGNPWPGPQTFMLVVTEPYKPITGGLIPVISQINCLGDTLNYKIVIVCVLLFSTRETFLRKGRLSRPALACCFPLIF